MEFRCGLALGKKCFVEIGVLRWIVVGKVGTFVCRHSDEASFSAARLDDMELPASELWVALQPLLQNGINVRFGQRAVRGELALEEWDNYDPACHHGAFQSSSKCSSQ